MSDRSLDTLNCESPQAMSIHTRKITDSCRDKDCIEDLRVYLTASSQELLNNATGARVRSAELLYAAMEVEPVAFDRKHYCIDVTFYYQILADATLCNCRPAVLTGVAVFSKRAVLCGEDSPAHIFRSDARPGQCDAPSRRYTNRPTAVVESLDPMVLSSKVLDVGECQVSEVVQIPEYIRSMFDEELVLSGEQRRLSVTLGQFSLIRLERDAQLVVPVLDYSIPTKECCDSATCCAEDPCEVFSRIPFPTRQFAPNDCDPGRCCEDLTR